MNRASKTIDPAPENAAISEAVQPRCAPAITRGTHLINIAIIVLACIAVFWKVFFLGYTLLDVNTLNNQLPWGYSAGKTDYPYDRRDPTDMYVTREYFTVQAYKNHELPLWNPYTMSGIPMYADGVTRIFSPFLLFYEFFDVPLGYSLARVTELLLAAIFMYLFLVAIGVGPRGALFGSLVLELSSHAMMHVTGLGWWGGLLWLPLILLFADRAIRRGSYRQAAIAGLFFAAQFYCAFMPNQIYYLGAILLYYLYVGFIGPSRAALRDSRGRLAIRAASMAAVTVVTGFVLSATQWAPVFELLGYSNRRIVPTEISYIYLPPWYIATLIFPNLFGSTYDARAVSLFTALNSSHDHVLYIGVAGLMALAFCLFRVVKTRSQSRISVADASNGSSDGETAAGSVRLKFFLILGAVAFILMMAAPVYVHLTQFIPVLRSIRVVVRAGVLWAFSAAALSAIGLEALMNAKPDIIQAFYKVVRKLFVLILVLAPVCVAVSYFLRSRGLQQIYEGKGRLAFICKAAGLLSEQFTPPNAGILLPILFFGLGLALLWLLLNQRFSKQAFFAALVALLFVDLAWNSIYFDRSFKADDVYPKTEITDFLKNQPPGRVLPEPSDIDLNRRVEDVSAGVKIICPPNTLLPYQIQTVTGKDQLFPKWYQRYARLIDRQPNMSHVVFDSDQSAFFDALNVRYIITHSDNSAPPNSQLLKTAEDVSVYENLNALPRAFFAKNVVTVGNEDDVYKVMKTPGFDPKSTAVVENLKAPVTRNAMAQDYEPVILRSSLNAVSVSTDTTQPELLILSDTYYPGWVARIDGTATSIYKTNLTMRAVAVPVGQHTVEFTFEPRSLRVSAYVTLVGIVVFLAAMFIPDTGLSRRAMDTPH